MDKVVKNLLNQNFGKQGASAFIAINENCELKRYSINKFKAANTTSIGSLAKTITSILILNAENEGLLKISDSFISHIVDDDSCQKSSLKDVQISHLLNHTHGIDESTFERFPRSNKRIDCKAIINKLEICNQIFEPSTLFFYGNIGGLLLGIILEKIYSSSISKIVNERFLSVLDIPSRCYDFCPSTGGDLKLSALDLIKISRLHIYELDRDVDSKPLLYLRHDLKVRMRPWPPMGLYYMPGWIEYSDGIGQYGYSDNGSCAIRILRNKKKIIAINSNHKKMAAAILSILLQDKTENNFLYSKAEGIALNLKKKYVGEYVNWQYKIIISLSTSDDLMISYSYNNDSFFNLSFFPCGEKLLVIGEHLFVTYKINNDVCPYFYFISSHDNEYIDTGKYLYKKVLAH